MKLISIVFAGLLGALSAMASFSASAADANLKTVAALNQEKATLAGQTISAKGKVVKVGGFKSEVQRAHDMSLPLSKRPREGLSLIHI